MPELHFLLATDLAVLDHRDGSLLLIANVIRGLTPDADTDPAAAYDEAVARLESMTADLLQARRGIGGDVGAAPPETTTRNAPRSADYMAAVDVAKEHIRAGDCFQIVVSQRFEMATDGGPARRLPGAAYVEPVAVHVPAAVRRPRRRRVVAGGAGQGRGRPGADAPDRRHPAARRDTGGGRGAGRGAAQPTRRSAPST